MVFPLERVPPPGRRRRTNAGRRPQCDLRRWPKEPPKGKQKEKKRQEELKKKEEEKKEKEIEEREREGGAGGKDRGEKRLKRMRNRGQE